MTDPTTARGHASRARNWAQIASDHIERGELDAAETAARKSRHESDALIGEISLLRRFAPRGLDRDSIPPDIAACLKSARDHTAEANKTLNWIPEREGLEERR